MAFISPTTLLPRASPRPAHKSPASKHRPHTPTARARHARMTATSPSSQETIETAWPAFAAKMKESGEIPSHEEWHQLLDVCVAANDDTSKAIWVLNLMRETGRTPTAATYERVLKICARHEDRSAAFHLVEGMFRDKVLLGDVDLPDGMEDVLRKILPPEAFE